MEALNDANLDRKVMHVDDDPAILALVGKALTKRGYVPIPVSEPELALPRLIECSPRIVLLDIDMPGTDGLKLLRDIKRHDGGIQIIMLTGLVSMSTILRSTRLGAEDCFYKPIYNLDEVMDSVDRAYAKMLRWWAVLREWRTRKQMLTESFQR